MQIFLEYNLPNFFNPFFVFPPIEDQGAVFFSSSSSVSAFFSFLSSSSLSHFLGSISDISLSNSWSPLTSCALPTLMTLKFSRSSRISFVEFSYSLSLSTPWSLLCFAPRHSPLVLSPATCSSSMIPSSFRVYDNLFTMLINVALLNLFLIRLSLGAYVL